LAHGVLSRKPLAVATARAATAGCARRSARRRSFTLRHTGRSGRRQRSGAGVPERAV